MATLLYSLVYMYIKDSSWFSENQSNPLAFVSYSCVLSESFASLYTRGLSLIGSVACLLYLLSPTSIELDLPRYSQSESFTKHSRFNNVKLNAAAGAA